MPITWVQRRADSEVLTGWCEDVSALEEKGSCVLGRQRMGQPEVLQAAILSPSSRVSRSSMGSSMWCTIPGGECGKKKWEGRLSANEIALPSMAL